VFLEGQENTNDRILVQTNNVSAGYFRTLGIPITRGRDFTPQDRDGAPAVVVVNETMATRFWPNEDPIGKRFRFFGEEAFTEVVGVARDAKYNGLVEDDAPFIYEPLLQDYAPTVSLLVRTAGPAGQAAGPLRTTLAEIDSSLSWVQVRTLREVVDQSLAPQQFNASLLSFFGLLALGLAAIGIYGVANYAVNQRTKEIGLRMALGAAPRDVLGLIMRQSLALTAIGLVAGLAGAGVVSAASRSLLVGVGAWDPTTYLGTAATLFLAAAAASYLPARRATQIDPLIALRHE
jgi:predicted permease